MLFNYLATSCQIAKGMRQFATLLGVSSPVWISMSSKLVSSHSNSSKLNAVWCALMKSNSFCDCSLFSNAGLLMRFSSFFLHSATDSDSTLLTFSDSSLDFSDITSDLAPLIISFSTAFPIIVPASTQLEQPAGLEMTA